MACRLPEADSLDAYWNLLVEGRSAVRPLTDRVLDRELHFDSRKGLQGKTYTGVGGLVPERPLDRKLLGLDDQELAAWDECHLMFAEVAAQAWKQANQIQSKAAASNVGVYIGHSGGSRTAGDLIYATLSEQTADLLNDSAEFSSLSPSVQAVIIDRLVRKMKDGRPLRGDAGKPYLEASAAARLVAEVLKLNGPRMVLDAACASSLVALGLAALDLQSGAIDSAIVGGASYNKVDSLILFSQAQSCSPTASRPFDENADGLIASEGYIAIVIKTLERAIEDGDTIHGVLRGLGLATDGRGKSLWAPRREGQTLAMKRAYATPEDAKRVQYLEAHATSTQVGDATETQALADYFGAYHNVGSLPVGSVKSNIGHTLETAGLAGLVKTLLAMKNGTIPPTINLEQPSSSIDWKAVPFSVPTNCIPWPVPNDGTPRCGAVNAFGIGGLNVHVVAEQFDADYHRRLVTKNDSSRTISKLATEVSREPIAIVGYGVIVPGAQSAEQLAQLIESRKSKIVEPPENRWRHRIGISATTKNASSDQPYNNTVETARGGYLLDYAYDWKKHRVPPKQVDRANPLQFMLLDAAGQALEHFMTSGQPIAQDRTSVIVGTIFGGEFGHQLQLGLRICDLQRDLHEVLDSIQDLRNPSVMIDEFTQSVLIANPALLDETGSFTSSTLASRITKQFNLMGGAMAIDAGDCSGESALVTATEMLRSNVSDMVLCAAGQRAMDLPSYQTWNSRGQLSDDPTAQRLPAEGAVVLLLKRLSDAQKSGDPIHGIVHDVKQIKAGQIGVDDPQIAQPFHSNALCEQIGDLKSAQSLFAIASLLATKQSPEGQPRTIRSSPSSQIAYEVVVSRGGIVVANSHLHICEPSALAAGSSGAQSPTHEPEASGYRSQRKLVSTGKLSAEYSSVRHWSDESAKRPWLVAIFPGQGSQAPKMLDGVLSRYARARDTLALADSTLRELGSATFDELLRIAASNALPRHRIWPIQSTMLIANLVYSSAIIEQGFHPDMVMGHSLGELAAMVVAGAWSMPEALRFVKDRANAVANQNHAPSGLVSINQSADIVQDALAAFPLPVVLTHDNSPNQSVVGGRTEHLQEFQNFVANRRWSTVLLNVPAAFHTPLMVDAQIALVESARKANLRPATIPLLSTVTGRFISDPDEFRRILLQQLVTPVGYRSGIEKAYRLGGRAFVEVGPGAVLSRLNQAILKSDPCTCIALADNLAIGNALNSALSQPIELVPPSYSEKSLLQAQDGSDRQIIVIDATESRRKRRRERATSPLEQQKMSEVTASPIPEAKPKVPPAVRSSELEAFVRDFIIEHTGYPTEMIELDWDLEADLGIDSIKQAQLFGELRELFDVDMNLLASGSVRTMRQLVAVLETSGGKREWIEDEPSNKSNQRPESTIEAKSTSVASPMSKQIIADRSVENSPIDRSDIATFMIDFVVEHTGYPREIVDMHADFEADLGLDSIKLAQLFGELRSNFELAVAGNDRSVLANCRTLNDILELFPADQSDEGLLNDPKESGIDQIYAKGLAWGQLNAVKLQSRLIEAIDSLGSRSNFNSGTKSQHGVHDHRVSNQLNIGDSTGKHLRDHDWWRGASAGAGVDEAFLLGDVDHIAELLQLSEKELSESFPEPNESHELLAKSVADKLSVSEFNGDDTFELPTESITRRYQLKMVDSPLPEGSPTRPEWKGAAVILGGNAVAEKLAQSLAADGVRCLRLDSSLPRDQLVLRLEEAWKIEPILHAFLATPHDEAATIGISAKEWRDRRQSGMTTAFWFCQDWVSRVIAAEKIHQASLIALTRLGGDFGFEAAVLAPESGTLTGLLKAIVIENWVNGHRGLAVKVIDASSNESPQQLVEAAYREIANTSYDMEISWANGQRKVVRADLSPIRKLRNSPITRGGAWICTGGGRGITAYAAEQLALRYDLTLHLVGTAPVANIPDEWRNLEGGALRQLKLSIMQQARTDSSPSAINPIKAWENVEKGIEIDATLRRLKSQGIQAYYYSCDCSNVKQLREVVSQIRKVSGPIRGCLHGAGVGQDARFERKRPEKVEQCLSAKVDGTIALMEVTATEPLEFFFGFGSISGRFGANGHSDYSMANDGMAKCIDWYRHKRPDVRAVCFHWHAWGDVGMATKPETRLALEMIDMQFMPAREGVEHLVREIEGGAPMREVLITDDRYYRLFYPSETLLNNQASENDKLAYGLIEEQEDTACNGVHPLSNTSERAKTNVARVKLDPVGDVFLREHCLNDRPLLPMVIGLEAIVESAARHFRWRPIQFGGPAIQVQGFESFRGFRFFQDGSQVADLISTSTSSDMCSVELVADFYARNGSLVETRRRYMRASVFENSGKRLLDWTMLDGSRLHWNDAIYPAAGSAFYVGPAFRVLKQTSLRDSRIVGRIQAPSLIELAGTRRNVVGWRTPSAVIDACLFATGILAWNHVRPGINLPVSIDSMAIHKMPTPGETCFVESRFVRRNDRNAWFDFCLWGSDRTIRLEAVGYKTAWLESQLPTNPA